MISVRVSILFFVALGMIVYVNSLNMSASEFESMGGLRICYGSFNHLFNTICQSLNYYATGQCGNVSINFSDQTVVRQVLVCRSAGNIIGCGYAANGSDTTYNTMAYSGGACG